MRFFLAERETRFEEAPESGELAGNQNSLEKLSNISSPVSQRIVRGLRMSSKRFLAGVSPSRTAPLAVDTYL